MTTLHQLTDNCLAVAGLPSDAYNIEVEKDLLLITTPNRKEYQDYIQLPTGNLRILGKSNELTEEQWKEVVVEATYKWGNYQGFKDYEGFFYHHDTATESGASLLKLHQLESPLILIKE